MLAAALLMLALGAASMGGGPNPVPDLPTAPQPTISLTTVNWGKPVSLLDEDAASQGSDRRGWGHLAPQAGPTDVVGRIELRGLLVHDWAATLTSDAAFGGIQPAGCHGSEEAAPVELSCTFPLAVSIGGNHLTLTFVGDGRVLGIVHGTINGGDLAWDAGYEILDATGRWTPIARDHAVRLPATTRTAVREVITNTGTIPMRLDPAGSSAGAATCSARILQPHERLVCPWRGVRPAQSLAGDFRGDLRVIDAVGGIGEYEVRGGLATFSGTFSLAAPSVTVGQVVVVEAEGLPTGGDFSMQFRLGDEPVLVGTSITSTGRTRLSFPLPSTPVGPMRLNVVHEGLTIASLPFDVTLVPRSQETPPVWPWAFLVVVPAGVAAILLVRRRRRRGLRRPVTGSPGRPPTDPYPDASPATPEPAAARRR